MKLNTYLHFDGQCREAFETYARVLGGKVAVLMTYGEAPMGGKECPPAERDKIIHVRLEFGDQVLMGSDSPPGHAAPLSGFSISINVTSDAEAERVYKALSEGGKVFMPLEKTFWAKKFAMFADRFGTPWMVNYEEKAMEKAA